MQARRLGARSRTRPGRSTHQRAGHPGRAADVRRRPGARVGWRVSSRPVVHAGGAPARPARRAARPRRRPRTARPCAGRSCSSPVVAAPPSRAWRPRRTAGSGRSGRAQAPQAPPVGCARCGDPSARCGDPSARAGEALREPRQRLLRPPRRSRRAPYPLAGRAGWQHRARPEAPYPARPALATPSAPGPDRASRTRRAWQNLGASGATTSRRECSKQPASLSQ